MTATRTLAAIRFGFGLPLPDGAPDTVPAMLAALAGPDLAAQAWPVDGLAVIQPKLAELRGMKGAGRTDPALKPRYDALTQEVVAAVAHGERMTFVRALTAADGSSGPSGFSCMVSLPTSAEATRWMPTSSTGALRR